MAPKDENELRRMVKTMAEYDQGPIAMRFPRGNSQGVRVDKELAPLEIGRAEWVSRGSDVVFVAIGAMVETSLAAAAALAERGVGAGVVNARFLKPLDTALLDEVAESGAAVVTVEDNAVSAGFGSGVNEYLITQGYDMSRVKNLGIPDRFIEHGDRALLLAEIGLDSDGLARSALDLLNLDDGVYKPLAG
jgi:1-deoxy-D-xylulose-5-phosphate synthase